MSSQKTYPQNESVMFTLAQRLTNLVDEKKYQGINAKEQARALTISEASMSKYKHQKMEMRVSTLKEIAKYYNVSSDYILGLTDDPLPATSPDYEFFRKISDYTGLDRERITELHSLKNKAYREIINFILHDRNLFTALVNFYLAALLDIYRKTDYYAYLPHRSDTICTDEFSKAPALYFAELISILTESRSEFKNKVENDEQIKDQTILALAALFVDVDDTKNLIEEIQLNKADLNLPGFVTKNGSLKLDKYFGQLVQDIETQSIPAGERRNTIYSGTLEGLEELLKEKGIDRSKFHSPSLMRNANRD